MIQGRFAEASPAVNLGDRYLPLTPAKTALLHDKSADLPLSAAIKGIDDAAAGMEDILKVWLNGPAATICAAANMRTPLS